MGEVVYFTKLDGDAIVPTQAHSGDGAYDLFSLDQFTLHVYETRVARTGIAIALPEGYAALVLPRSGLAAKENITVVNSPGLIDSGYRGEICVILHKLYTMTSNKITIQPGDRIAQLMFIKPEPIVFGAVSPKVWEKKFKYQTARGDRGLGSTGQ